MTPLLNLTLSLVFLLGFAPRPGLHAAAGPRRAAGPADEDPTATPSGLHPRLLAAAAQRAALHHLHLPRAHSRGCPRLLFYVRIQTACNLYWEEKTHYNAFYVVVFFLV